jgi:hypothetical protein
VAVKRLPRVFAAFALGGCTAPPVIPDAGPMDAGTSDAGVSDAGLDGGSGYDAGVPDAGAHDGGVGTPWGDAGCVLPSDFPWDAGFASDLADQACLCTEIDALHCFEEDGPRCFSWACPPAKSDDGGYVWFDDGGVECLC